jgi:hypothetical protein
MSKWKEFLLIFFLEMLDHEKVFRKKLYRFEFETFDQVCGVNLQILQILLLYQNSPISLIILGK